jgi:hypothetical protein
VIEAGPFGAGSRLKYVANHAVAVHNAAAAESLAYAQALGLDSRTVYRLSDFNTRSNPLCQNMARTCKPVTEVNFVFQWGPLQERGRNGVTAAALLAVVLDHLQGQEGDRAQLAAAGVSAALDVLQLQGFTVIEAEQCWYKSLAPLMQEVRAAIGDHPTYLTYDIDSLDPAFAPGTGTPEVGGLATWQAQAILRRLAGLRFVGMDIVEVAPAYDSAEITALAAATMAWEYLALVAPPA